MKFLNLVLALLSLVPTTLKASAGELLKRFRLAPAPARRRPFAAIKLDGGMLQTLGPDFAARDARRRVERTVQHIGAGVVQGTWLQTIFDGSGDVVFQAGEWLENAPKTLEHDVDAMKGREPDLLEALRLAVPELQRAAHVFAPEIVISHEDGQFHTYWHVDFLNDTETQAHRIKVDRNFRVIGVREMGSRLSEGLASVFPKGPARSALEEVPIVNLDGSGHLVSPAHQVLSALETQAQSAQLDFRFPPQDDRFDQVQAFFFASEALHFFHERFDATPSARLEIKVQVGDRSNAAFYYRNKIRLGAGDGERYKELARDPSVVVHEVAHALVDKYSGLPSESEGGSLNEGFADYFAATLLNSPLMGESSFLGGPYLRTLENEVHVEEVRGRGLYKAAQVVSGTLWELRKAVGARAADELAFAALCRLNPSSTFADFRPALEHAALSALGESDRDKLVPILSARGWKEGIH